MSSTGNERRAGMTETQLIDRVFGNVHIEHPEITREQVVERLLLKNLITNKELSDLSKSHPPDPEWFNEEQPIDVPQLLE